MPSGIRDIEIGGETLRVSFTSTPYVPEKAYGPPEDCYPAEGGEFSIDKVELLIGLGADGKVQYRDVTDLLRAHDNLSLLEKEILDSVDLDDEY